jgi:hypothetical protein
MINEKLKMKNVPASGGGFEGVVLTFVEAVTRKRRR